MIAYIPWVILGGSFVFNVVMAVRCRRLARRMPVYTVQVGRRRWWDGIP